MWFFAWNLSVRRTAREGEVVLDVVDDRSSQN